MPRLIQPSSFLAFVILSLLAFAVSAQEQVTGNVVGISDGDTLTVLTAEKKQVKVRLAEIDTPESRQPYGTRARQALSELVFRQQVRVQVQDVDRYGRTVGRIYRQPDNLDVNAEMVRQGAAWVYRQYSKDKSLLKIEDEAKTAKRGLWGLPEAERTPPWEWRSQQRGKPKAVSKTPAKAFACGTKTYCREMVSCEEARFYLSSCGLTRLDGDGDGVPCEAVCR